MISALLAQTPLGKFSSGQVYDQPCPSEGVIGVPRRCFRPITWITRFNGPFGKFRQIEWFGSDSPVSRNEGPQTLKIVRPRKLDLKKDENALNSLLRSLLGQPTHLSGDSEAACSHIGGAGQVLVREA